MTAPEFTPPTEAEDGTLLLGRDEAYDTVMLVDSPPGVVGVYT